MPARKMLYLLRRPISDPAQSLLPSAAATELSSTVSLVLLEKALSSPPAFPGPIYILHRTADVPGESSSGKKISYRDLVTLIAEHDSTIVL
jgi:hypothetical protein